jgi:sigma-B regulation protein RsbU (phosphoserine phosphatase)
VRVLVVDDEPVVRRLLETSLTAWGYEVVAARGGEEAWQILKQDGAPSLGILDWTMPGLDGLELCKRVRALKQPVKPYLIFVTAKARTLDIVTGLGAGADDYIIKPFNRDELRARIQVGVRMLELQAMLAERVRELEEALGRVRQLQGLLPICSYCKKVRDDRNYWQQVETYIEGHSAAQFTHGICPDCREKYVEPELERLRQSRRDDEPPARPSRQVKQ